MTSRHGSRNHDGTGPGDLGHVSVVIVGAGPTGAAAAILLGSYGIDCVVLDRWHDVYPQPRAVHLDDEVYRILQHLGVAEAFAGISRPALGLRLLDRNLDVLVDFPRSGDLGIHGHPQANMFDQPELEALLRARLHEMPTVRLVGGVEVLGVHDDVDGATVVDLVDRESGSAQRVTADFVLGCDGANSTVRRAMESTMEDLGFKQQWLVIDVETEHELDQWEGVHQVCDIRRAATYMRIGECRYRWEFQLVEGERAEDYSRITDVHTLIRPWTGTIPAQDLRLVRTTGYTFKAQLADTWRRGSLFLLGDAAHLTPPFIGQGMGAGLRDAHNLAWKLAGVMEGELPRSVLDTYEVERKPHARSMIRMAVGIGVVMSGGGVIADRMRRLLLPRLRLVPGLRSKVVDSTTPALSRSQLCETVRWRKGLGGTLCPNVSLSQGLRVDDLPWTFLLITTDEPTTAQRGAVASSGAQIAVVEEFSPLGAWLRRGRASVAVVRPDRSVLHAGGDLGVACAALRERTLCRAGSTPGSGARGGFDC